MRSVLPVLAVLVGVAGCGATVTIDGDSGVGVPDDPAAPQTPAQPAPSMPRVAVGTGHGCAILADATVACWGFNDSGQVGVSFEESQSEMQGSHTYHFLEVPARVEGLSEVEQLSADWQVSCALVKGGDVHCWGSGALGALGPDAGAGPQPTPIRIAGIDHAVEVRTGGGPTCARTEDGSVWCWGSNSYQSVGVTPPGQSNDDNLPPTRVVGIDDAVEIAVADNLSCARHASGGVSCWGRVDNDPYAPDDPTPRRIAGFERAVQLALAQSSAMALLDDGTIATTSSLAGEPERLSGVRAIAAQYRNACALLGNGVVRCWGEHLARTEHSLMAKAIAVGTWSACAELEDGRVVCFGDASHGSLGTGEPGASGDRPPGAPVLLPR